ncbi:unnamed protein product [Rotaria magnacalcarata]|uniref:Uncharacterized protein n=1 Tax=Rotaria magnacalcarata TaxID=392030 RepID=A0A815EY64_9BILA|nr:unnamed protein product [Rotaria magnacalcarata]
MSVSKAKIKRTASSSPSIEPVINIVNGLFESYNFLAPNEYSEKTLGLLAFLLRKSIGEINFSDIIDDAEKRYQQRQQNDYVTLLEDRRKNLAEIEASIEKCLMITRLISYINENESQFLSLISDLRIDMRMRITDKPISKNIEYPADFRLREQHFLRRRMAQDVRRLFQFTHLEAKEPPSIIHLMNRTTEYLSYIIDCKMRYDPQFHEAGLKELETLFSTSFMILNHPHYGVNPVLIYERRGTGQCVAKLSVTLVSLLSDFMQSHPNLIELYDIETSVLPLSPTYKLESSTISWKTCCLQIDPNEKPRTIQYAELSLLTIQYPTNKNTRIHIGDELHRLKFSIKLRLNLQQFNFSRCYQTPLETLDFGIVSHNNYIPHSLTRVILSDIRRHTHRPTTDVPQLLKYILRFFCHRTGVSYGPCLKSYLEKELYKAQNERKNFQTMEDIYMDFLVPFVNQVEFMAKHPILAMFYADGLCLGICDSERAADIMRKSTDVNSPIIGLRLNSIKVDYETNSSASATSKTVKIYPCAVRVDIYNNRRKQLQYFTFASSILVMDIKKLINTAHTENGSHIRILSNLDNQTNAKNYKSFKDFEKYFHERLNKIYSTNEGYRPITMILQNIEDDGDDEKNHEETSSPNTILYEMLQENPSSEPPPSSKACNNESFSNLTSAQENIPIADAHPTISTIPVPRGFSTSSQQPLQSVNNQDIVQYVLDRPDMLAELLHRLGTLQVTSPTIQISLEQYYRNQQPLLSTQPQQYPTSFPMQYELPLYNQQLFSQSTSLPVAFGQTNNGNQCQYFPINNGQTSTQQNQLDTRASYNYEDIFDDIMLGSIPCNRTDQIK